MKEDEEVEARLIADIEKEHNIENEVPRNIDDFQMVITKKKKK